MAWRQKSQLETSGRILSPYRTQRQSVKDEVASDINNDEGQGLLYAQVPSWSRVGRLKRSKFPSLGGGGHTFGGGAGAGVMTVLAGKCFTTAANATLRSVCDALSSHHQSSHSSFSAVPVVAATDNVGDPESGHD